MDHATSPRRTLTSMGWQRRPAWHDRAKTWAFLLPMSVLASAAPALGSDFVDTRLNVTLTNENVLAAPGETNPPVPGWRFDRPNQLGVLFFDNYDTRFTGYESLTHIVLYKAIQRQRWEAEAAYVLRLLQFSDVNLSSAIWIRSPGTGGVGGGFRLVDTSGFALKKIGEPPHDRRHE